MAINTRDRRASAIANSLPWITIYPVPDGTITSEQDRRHAAGLYRATLTAPGGAVGFIFDTPIFASPIFGKLVVK